MIGIIPSFYRTTVKFLWLKVNTRSTNDSIGGGIRQPTKVSATTIYVLSRFFGQSISPPSLARTTFMDWSVTNKSVCFIVHFAFYICAAILQLRNPRDALPSYRSMKNEIDYQTTWFNVHQHVGRTYSFRTSTASWNEFLNHLGYFKLLIRQWAWQIDFYMEKGE